MEAFKDKVAVITGAASGIGLGLARRCVKEGIKVVLADIQEGDLARAKKELEAMGGTVMEARTDVTKAEEVESLAQKTIETFGRVDLLFNNAGVSTYGRLWDISIDDWRWVLDVNLWGVIRGVRAFVPIMLRQGTEAYIVNTASGSGMIVGAPANYTVSKFAVVALTESLYRELCMENACIRVSLLCPGAVATPVSSIDHATRRPAEYGGRRTLTEEQEFLRRWHDEYQQKGITPDQCAKIVFDAIRKNKFYIFTSPELTPLIHQRLDDIRAELDPTIFRFDIQ